MTSTGCGDEPTVTPTNATSAGKLALKVRHKVKMPATFAGNDAYLLKPERVRARAKECQAKTKEAVRLT